MIGLYGSVYSDLLDSVEAQIYSIISRHGRRKSCNRRIFWHNITLLKISFIRG
jgi:hypothetical protein